MGRDSFVRDTLVLVQDSIRRGAATQDSVTQNSVTQDTVTQDTVRLGVKGPMAKK